MALSENLILQKTKLAHLAEVKNLNLWGAELNEVSIVQSLPNLEVLALSVNHVSALDAIAECKSLRELYLRKNNVSSLSEVARLAKLTQLTTLWLSDNPVAKEPNYRLFTIRCCSQLKQLDSIEVSAQERAEAQKITERDIKDVASKKTPSPTGSAPPAAAPAAAPVVAPAPEAKRAEDPREDPRREERRHERRHEESSSRKQTQRAILSSIVMLLGELNNESLDVLEREIGKRRK